MMRMKISRFQSRRGVTLIEVLSAVVVAGVITALAAPNFDRAIERIKFKSQTKEVVSMLRAARSKAITEKTPYGVNFDYVCGTISLFKEKSSPPNSSFDAGTDSVVATDSLSSGDNVHVYSTFSNSTVFFQPNGSATQSGDVDLWAYNESASSYSRINVLASTGRSKVTYVEDYCFGDY
jgi:prepilin-type N-terminal cleavage/methylation domain-containing protein